MTTITKAHIYDARYQLQDGAGSDAVHTDPEYGYAVTVLETDDGRFGTGIHYTLGGGTNLVCEAIRLLVTPILGVEIEELMSRFGHVQRSIAEHPQIRWLGPHKGVTHGALASITNACFDLWCKCRELPLWKLLLSLSNEEIVRILDLRYLEDVLTTSNISDILDSHRASRPDRQAALAGGYPGYDTSVGWFQYEDQRLVDNARQAVDAGFTALKLKVGAKDSDHDVRRTRLVRDAVGHEVRIMLDANQAWSLPEAVSTCLRLASIDPYWIEEPTQPDDVLAHQTLARVIAPMPIAVGEAVANRVIWKNFLQAGAVGIIQADCTRLAGVSEYLAVAFMAKNFPVKVIPHVGDMGQIHQHLVCFNHIALGHEKLFLEYIPHLRDYFVFPATIDGGAYRVPQDEPGCSTDLRLDESQRLGTVTL